jgi:tRNA1(Val) A37 N6-methylase TrmN6
MSITKTQREKKRQLGQFLTPPLTARQLVEQLPLQPHDKVLEPSMGDGSFVLPLIEKFMSFYEGSTAERLAQVLTHNIYGVEIDETLYHTCLANIQRRWGTLPSEHNFYRQDFFRTHFATGLSAPTSAKFSYIIGNPPFGGTIDPDIQDELDKVYGFRNGEKIKKETYSFFIVKSLDLLAPQGTLLFICSDTFLTIKTMRGLRRLLMSQGEVQITDLAYFSEETSHPMLVLRFLKNGYQNHIFVNQTPIERSNIELTDNFSWRIHDGVVKYFAGPSLGEYVVATSGMTVGKNEYFVREIVDGNIEEPYEFIFFADPITLSQEKAKARLGKLSPKKMAEILQQEQAGATRRNVRVAPRPNPLKICLPHPDYAYYNKGVQALVYCPPTHAIFWKDNGDAVLTFKKNGNWYLHGVGGQKFFLREGLTWQLIAQSLHIRYLPAGYILDSGAPCAFLREGVDHDELYFIFGWALTLRCNQLLKEVINHTKNIQGKDFERLPYPFWVRPVVKQAIVGKVKGMIALAMNGHKFTRHSPELDWLEMQFAYTEEAIGQNGHKNGQYQPLLPLF